MRFMVAPKETQGAIVTRLADALSKALDDRAVQRRFLDLGSSVPAAIDRGPAVLQQLMEAEIARITPIIKAAGAPAD